MAEFEKGFGDGAGCGSGEADDADSAAAGGRGDGNDGVFEDGVGFGVGVAHLDFSMLAGEKNWRGVLRGFLRKTGFRTWCFAGVSVVNCTVNVVFKQRGFEWRKMRHVFEVYFFVEARLRPERIHKKLKSFACL